MSRDVVAVRGRVRIDHHSANRVANPPVAGRGAVVMIVHQALRTEPKLLCGHGANLTLISLIPFRPLAIYHFRATLLAFSGPIRLASGEGMGSQLILGLRRIAAVGCIAVACLFCVQTTIAHLDRVEHALGIDHDAVPLVGPVHHHHHATDKAGGDCGESKGTHPVSHAHQGDTAFSFLLAASCQIIPVDVATRGSSLTDAVAVRGMAPGIPDRPPKA